MPPKTDSKKSNKLNSWDNLILENSSKPVVYFFSSDNCQFCTAASPYIKALAMKYEKHGVEVITVDVDDNPDIREDANVQSWPSYLFVQGKKIVGKDVGWEEGQRIWLEERLGLDKTYKVDPGLALSDEELAAIKEDPNAVVGEKDSSQPAVSGCGDSTQQVAEIAAGMDEALTRIDNKLRSILARLDAIESRFAPLSDDIMAAVGAKPDSGSKCKCGKHKED